MGAAIETAKANTQPSKEAQGGEEVDMLPSFLSTQPGHIDFITTTSNDIHQHLAFEEYLFGLPLKNPIVFLWRNGPSIIIGRHQNPWKECHVKKLEDDGIALARRKSGGGCVYQDLGNTCFTFIRPVEQEFDTFDPKTSNNDILMAALEELGVEARARGRNDLVVNYQGQERKISESAYKLKQGDVKTGKGRRSLHHGTMLVNVDMDALEKYLNPGREKSKSQGIDSVVQRGINLKEIASDIDHDKFCEAVERALGDQKLNKKVLSEQDLSQIPNLKRLYAQQKNWQWRFGTTFKFTNSLEKKLDWAHINLEFDVEKGINKDGQHFSDCLESLSLKHAFIQKIIKLLGSGEMTYDVEGMKDLGEQLRTTQEEWSEELEKWLGQTD